MLKDELEKKVLQLEIENKELKSDVLKISNYNLDIEKENKKLIIDLKKAKLRLYNVVLVANTVMELKCEWETKEPIDMYAPSAIEMKDTELNRVLNQIIKACEVQNEF